MDAKSVAAASDQDVGQKLKEVEAAARRAAELGIQRKPPEIVMDPGDESAAGRRKMKGGEKWDVSSGKESAVGEREPEVVKTDEEKDVELELNTILKRSPSKSNLSASQTRYLPVCLTEMAVQSLYSPSPIVVFREKPRTSSTNTRLYLHPSWWS